MFLFKRKHEDSISLKKILFLVLPICLFIAIASIMFYKQLQTTVKQESEHYLKEISGRITSNVNRIINDNFSVLKTMSFVLENSELASFTDTINFLSSQTEFWDFTNILLIDNNGIAYDLQGKAVNITGDSFLRDFEHEKNTIALNQIINNQEATIFSSPLNNVVIEEKSIIALATMYEPEQFDAILSMSSFDEQAYSYIISQQGTVVMRSSSSNAATLGYNVFKTLDLNNPTMHNSIANMQENMRQGISGQVTVTIDDKEQYLIYTPIGIQDWFLFTFVPNSVVNSKSNLLLRNTVFMILIIFVAFLTFLTIIIRSFTKHKKRLEQIAYTDDLTGGNTVQRFYLLTDDRLKNENKKYALIFSNIQKFKVLNDQFGRPTCDKLLISLHDGIQCNLQNSELIARYSADNFVMLLEYNGEEDLQNKFMQWETSCKIFGSKYMELLPLYTIEYGIYIIDDTNVSVIDMIDRAKLALRNGTSFHKDDDFIRYVFYSDKVRHSLIREKHLENMMEKALLNDEFKVYLQPKYLTGTKKIAGAEALVRWQSRDDGMIFPTEFIPLFEKNGFIVKLDLFMFEQVCKLLQSWKDSNKPLICISVNCSRVHLKNPDFLSSYIKIFKNFDFESKYLELEFTENIVFEENQNLPKIIDDIHEIGFECSMDDFGSGYSSLNLLQDIHVDTLKLDRIFFKNSLANSARTKAIVNSILDMAQSLGMRTVAEGIEEWAQVDILQSLGCDLIQGYVYAKPMPTPDFQDLFFAQLTSEEDTVYDA